VSAIGTITQSYRRVSETTNAITQSYNSYGRPKATRSDPNSYGPLRKSESLLATTKTAA
jgi:hypothetical protein